MKTITMQANSQSTLNGATLTMHEYQGGVIMTGDALKVAKLVMSPSEYLDIRCEIWGYYTERAKETFFARIIRAGYCCRILNNN